MESRYFLLAFLLFCLAESCYGGVRFSSLPETLIVTGSPQQGQVLKAGEDKITVLWSLYPSIQSNDDSYKHVKLSLCYAPVSQADRPWRLTTDNLSKDKTCQYTIIKKLYARNQSYEWTIEKDVPEATYFVRIYAYDSAGEAVAYGQTTDDEKRSSLFEIRAISGRHLSLEIASICFSAFSVISSFGFLLVEKSKRKGSSKN